MGFVSIYRASDLLLVEPDNGNLTFSVAILHSVLGDVSLALEYIDRTIEITPNDSSIYWIKAEYLYSEQEHIYTTEKMFTLPLPPLREA